MSGARIRMRVQGMTCEACNAHVIRALQRTGAWEVEADYRRGEAQFSVNGAAYLHDFAEAVHAAGYRPGGIEILGEAKEAS